MAAADAPRDETAPRYGAGDFEVLERIEGYRGFFRLDRVRARFRRYGGGWSAPIEREVFERGHAACVLAYDPTCEAVVLVEQFRVAAIEAPGGPWLIETIAGVIEPGEAPDAVARREAVEEAGLEIGDLFRIGEILVTPGGSSERLVLYCGRCDAANAGGVHGLACEDEDLRVVVLTLDHALAAIDDGRIRTANAVIPLLWLALNRERVRDAWRQAG